MMNSGNNEVVVTGLGPVTAVGVGQEALWSSLTAGRLNVVRRRLGVGIGQFLEMPMAAMPPADQVAGLEIHRKALAEEDCAVYRDLTYALLAVELALADARLPYDRNANNIGAVQAFEAPGLERAVSGLLELFAGPPPTDGPPPVYDLLAPSFYRSQAFFYVHVLGHALGFHGFSTSVHNACASGAFAIEIAAERIRSGQADVMVVVGGEAFDTAVRLEWFHRLNLYAQDGRMRPFDDEPSGFYVGEGAGALVLESAAHAARRGATPYATYAGGAFAHQAAMQVTPDVQARRLGTVITTALNRARLDPHDVDLIVPHGAGTAACDGYEAACVAQALPGGRERTAAAAVFKPYVGHTLAASAVLETICALLSLRHQCVPAAPHTRPEHVQPAIPLVARPVERPLKTVLKLSTGFTGHDAALVFRRI